MTAGIGSPLQRTYEWVRRLFGFHSPTLAEFLEQAFNEEDRRVAELFYDTWADRVLLNVQVGDGNHALGNGDEFYAKAWIVFFRPPFRVGSVWILANHAEDELGSIVMQHGKRQVYYDYGSSLYPIAENLREFFARLQAAGWSWPELRLADENSTSET